MYQDEEKKYSIIGKVEIGTDEYRDLIESLAKTRVELSEKNSQCWELRSKLSTAENQVKAYKEDSEMYWEFINSNEEIKAKYKLFKIEKTIK